MSVRPSDWTHPCGPRDLRNSNGSGGNCWKLRRITDADGAVIYEIGDSKEDLLGSDQPLYILTAGDMQQLAKQSQAAPELARPDYYTELATPRELTLESLALRIVPLKGTDVHVCWFGSNRGPSFTAAETAAFFDFLARHKVNDEHWVTLKSVG